GRLEAGGAQNRRRRQCQLIGQAGERIRQGGTGRRSPQTNARLERKGRAPAAALAMNGGARKKRTLRRYLVAGVLVWLPILATVWVVTFMLRIMDRTLLLLPPSYRPEALVGFSLPGLGAVFALIVLLLTG